jgi:hypothetical protein
VKGQFILGYFREFDGGEPAFESVRADLRFKRSGQLLPKGFAALIHTNLLTT